MTYIDKGKFSLCEKARVYILTHMGAQILPFE